MYGYKVLRGRQKVYEEDALYQDMLGKWKGWLPIAKLKKIYKDRLDSGVTWLKWLPHSMEQYGRLAPKSNKVNYQKLTLYFKKIHR